MNCWLCGIEPDDITEVGSLNGVVREIPKWPAGDHRHAERPPSPESLERAGRETLARIVGYQ